MLIKSTNALSIQNMKLNESPFKKVLFKENQMNSKEKKGPVKVIRREID